MTFCMNNEKLTLYSLLNSTVVFFCEYFHSEFEHFLRIHTTIEKKEKLVKKNRQFLRVRASRMRRDECYYLKNIPLQLCKLC